MLGISGSGKSTIVNRIISDSRFVSISTGDIYREHVLPQLSGADIEFDKKHIETHGVSKYYDNIKDKLLRFIDDNYKTSNIIIDGAPRTLDQCHFFMGNDFNPCFCFVDIDMHVALNRLIKRSRSNDSKNYSEIISSQAFEVDRIKNFIHENNHLNSLKSDLNYIHMINIPNFSSREESIMHISECVKNFFLAAKDDKID